MSGFKEFIIAVKGRDSSRTETLFKKEFVNERLNGWTVLHFASERSDGDIVRYLLSVGCDIEAEVTVSRWRPIHVAARYGNTEALKALIEAQCSLDCFDSDERTPFDVAEEYEEVECIRLLGEAAKDGRTPFDVVKESTNGNDVERIRLLEEAMKPIWIGHKEKEVIGHGGFGRVYKCYNPRTKEYFVKKEVLLLVNKNLDKDVKALEREIDLYMKFGVNPYIVRYYGSDRTKDAMFIYLEFMEGGSITEQLISCKKLHLDTIASYTKQILCGLIFLHEKNVIHRDIKPDNILLDKKGNVRMCDFGISRNLSRISSIANRHCGTHYYIAPEVHKGEEYGFPADIWSLGVTVLEMLTGHTLYPGLNQYAFTNKIGSVTEVEYDTPETTPQDLKSFLGQMLIYEPRNRATAKILLKTQFILGAITPLN